MNAPFIIVSHGASVDRESGNISIFEIVEDVHAAAFPVLFQRSALVMRLVRDEIEPTQADLVLGIHHAGAQIASSRITVSFNDRLETNVVTKIEGMIIPGPGDLRISVEHNERTLTTYRIRCHNAGGPRMTTSG